MGTIQLLHTCRGEHQQENHLYLNVQVNLAVRQGHIFVLGFKLVLRLQRQRQIINYYPSALAKYQALIIRQAIKQYC